MESAPASASTSAAWQPHGPSPRAPGARAARGPLGLYQAGIAEGRYRHDDRQDSAMRLLQALFVKLEARYPRKKRPSNLTMVDNVATARSKNSWWSAVLSATDPHLAQQRADAGGSEGHIRGTYLWGGVGVGKTMLMDLFVEAAPREFHVARRHFHDFMLDVHARLRDFSGEQDPLRKVADTVASRMRVLCLDELFVTNVADAMILERLFGRLWDRGLVLVATSNRRPDTLYEGGLQRQLFMPFVRRLEAECNVHDMASPTDYRRLATRAVGAYFVRLVEGATNDDRLDSAFRQATHDQASKPRDVAVAMGRVLHVRVAVGPAASFLFPELCTANVAAADFIALANAFHTLALKGVPIVTGDNRSSAYRFVTLIDVLYEHRCKLLISAEAYPDELFRNVVTESEAADAGASLPQSAIVDDNLGFAKDRAVSRLLEMQTLEYALAHAERHTPEMCLALYEARAKATACAPRHEPARQ